MPTAVEKIFSMKAGKPVKAGDIVVIDVDSCMIHDLNGPATVKAFEKIADTVLHPEKHLISLDHFAPSPNVNAGNNHVILRNFARKHGIDMVEVCHGVCHQVMMESGKVRPGDIIAGTDSHACQYGALNAFSTGIGAAEAAIVFASGKNWFKVPETIRVELLGTMPENVTGKDVILTLIGMIGEAGSAYQCLEFGGDGLRSISFDSRTTISNMAVECGAKGAIMPYDEITEAFMKAHGIPEGTPVEADADAIYARTVTINLSELVPVVAAPPSIDNIHPSDEYHHVPVDEVVIGSCTNGRYEDFKLAADILRGKRIADRVRLLCYPSSLEVANRIREEGIDKILTAAGGSVFPPNCGPCPGIHGGLLGDGEVCVTTTNRNVPGRMGSKLADVYVASSVTAAYSALNGVISAKEI